MLVNGIERLNVIEYKGTWKSLPYLTDKKEPKRIWWMDLPAFRDYPLVNYHVFEYKEWCDDFHYTVLETAGGTKVWTLNGKVHREDDEPAMITGAGCKLWYKNNLCHRDLGPALHDVDGFKQWLQNDNLHNEFGPAQINEYGETLFYIHGRKITDSDLKNYKGLARFSKMLILK